MRTIFKHQLLLNNVANIRKRLYDEKTFGICTGDQRHLEFVGATNDII